MRTNQILLVLLIFSFNIINAQIQFEELIPTPEPDIINNFNSINYSTFAYADVDNDNDLDVLISGSANFGQKIVRLYINDGNGNYTLNTNTSFIGVYYGAITFADVDNDNDQDVLISGTDEFNDFIVNLYINDGNGSFSLDTNTNFEIVYNGNDSAFADIDNDNDLDLIIGRYLYTNDGNGNFSLVPGTPFYGTVTEVKFADVDNDNDQDLMMLSLNGGNTSLFINDGNGDFTLDISQNLIELWDGDIEFGDIDNDNDLDVLLSGRINNPNDHYSKLYRNDGNGNFILDESFNTLIVIVLESEFSDFDLDGDLDLIISGDDDPENNGTIDGLTQLYINDGTGHFTENPTTIFNDFGYSQFINLDIDNDNDQDIILNQTSPQIFINDGNSEFELVVAAPFEEVNFGSVAYADIDNDNDLDVLITGNTNYLVAKTKLYSNDGNGNYTLIPNTPFENVDYSTATFIDVDGDQDQDVLISGTKDIESSNYYTNISRLYINDGNGNFSLDQGSALNLDIEDGSLINIAFADVDDDNDQDALVLGYFNSGSTISNLYLNDGSGNFSIDANTPFWELAFGDIVFNDLDNDGDKDLFFLGFTYNGSQERAINQYLNDGNGNFSLMPSNFNSFYSDRSTTLAFADIDNDNDNDLIIAGSDLEEEEFTQLYTNDGIGNFELVDNTPFENVYNGSIAFSDVDNDNDEDVIISGTNSIVERSTNLYINNGLGTYTLEEGLPFINVSSSDIKFADVNNDTKTDVLITGWDGFRKTTKIYNNTSILNTGENIIPSKNSLYPNPSTGRVYFSNYHNGSNYIARISTIEGRLIEIVNLSNENNFSFEIKGSKGIYIVELVSGNLKEVHKIIKN